MVKDLFGRAVSLLRTEKEETKAKVSSLAVALRSAIDPGAYRALVAASVVVLVASIAVVATQRGEDHKSQRRDVPPALFLSVPPITML